MDGDQRSDEDLARQAGGGDKAAFTELYRRYFGRIYDFTLRLTRDREQAALVVQVSFLRAYQALRTGEAQAPFKLQLYAIARHDVSERQRGRRAPVLEGEEAFAAADPARLADPALAAALPELAHQAWQAARELKLDEYELLDLSVRQQLDAGEIAAVLRTRQESVEGTLIRLGGAFEESFTSLLLLSRGRRECLDLDFLVGDDQWSSALRRRILRHLQSCETCQGTRRRYPTAAEMLAALTPVPPPAGWQETILERLQGAAPARGEAAAEPAPVVPAATTPPPRRPVAQAPPPAGGDGGEGIGGWFRRLLGQGGTRWPLLAALGGGLLVVIIALAALCGTGAFDGDEAKPTATASPTATTTLTATLTATPTPTTTATLTPRPPATATSVPTSTPLPPTATPAPPAATPAPPTATPVPPATATSVPPMATPAPPTTAAPPMDTPVP